MTSAIEGQIEFEHYHRYCFARDLCDGCDVLDVASGEGYGAAMLASVARSVVGVEIDTAAVAHAQTNYRMPNLRFLHGDALELPLVDSSVDVVVSFETLEHLSDQTRFIHEVRRVLRPGGLFVVSTPDRAVYSAPGSDPNPYHVLELTESEFRSLLDISFAHNRVLSQRPVLGSVLAANSISQWRTYERRGSKTIEATNGLARAHYLIAVASDEALPDVFSSVYVDRRCVHDVVQDALHLPEIEAQLAELVHERDAARAEAAQVAELVRDRDAARAEAAQVAELVRDRDTARYETARLTEALKAEQSVRETRVARLVRHIIELVRERATTREEAARTAEELRQRTEERAEELRQQTQERAEELRQQTQERAEELRQRTQERDAARAEAARVAEALAAAEATATSVMLARDAIIYSTSWRLTAPLREWGRHYPRTSRILRRSGKLVWWTVTLQIGQRYILRRRHQARLMAASQFSEARVVSAIEAAAATAIEATAATAIEAAAATAIEAAAATAIEKAPAKGNGAQPLVGRSATSLRDAFLAWHGSGEIYFPPVAAPEVSVVIPAYRGLGDLQNCLRSLTVHRVTGPSFEVILVDDCPAESVLGAIPDSGGLVKVANSENMGFLLTCNYGASMARGRFICFLNSDTIVSAGWLRSLVEALEEVPEAAMVGGMLLNVDGSIQSAGWRILNNGWGHPIGVGGDPHDGAYTYRRQVDCVTGACIVMRRMMFEQLGGFDMIYAPAFYEEFDLAFRARAHGWRVIYEPRSRVVHLGSASYGADIRDALSSINHAEFSERFADVLRKHPWDNSDEFTLRHASGEGPVLLVIEWTLPQPDRHAGDVTISRYLSILATAGWRVVFGAMDGAIAGPAAEVLERQGIELIRPPRTIGAWLADHGRHVQEVWVARPEIAQQVLPLLRAHSSAPIAYYTHDLHHVRVRREAELHADPEMATKAALIDELERGIFRSVNHITSPSEEEAEIIRKLAPETPVTVLPPFHYEAEEICSHDAAHFTPLSDVVFVGGFPHTPNVDAAVFIVNVIMPLVWCERPDVRLVLVGYAPPPEVRALAGLRVFVTGQVPSVEPFLDCARVFLGALRYGAGVKGKTVDAMRQGVPVVTTQIGSEGIGIEPGHHAIVAEDPAALAAGVLELLRDPERCAELSVAGADLVRRRFSRVTARRAIGSVFRTPRCAVCGSGHLAKLPCDGTFREAFVCRNCFALGRTEALARVVLGRVAESGEDSLTELARRRPNQRVHEFGFVGGIADTLRGQPWFSMSEYFDEIPVGTLGPHSVPCEDLTRLTFADRSFDIVISQDVIEHVPDPAAAFAEIVRVLRPGGAHVFTVPYNPGVPKSIARARLDPHGIEYFLPPAYHGDPIRADGALVFTDFGGDLKTMLHEAGLELTIHELPVLGGQPSQTVQVFEAVKGTGKARSATT
jgi:GT2 family glycosyltransferase/SAM-dependent methyltransferase